MSGNPLTPLTGPPDTDFWRLDKRLRSTEMRVVYVGVPDPDFNGGQRRWWDLAGNHGGKQGLDLAPHVTGLMHTPFVSLFTEGPYQIGSTYERTDYKKRIINLGVMVSNSMAPDTSFRYRMLEQRWWASWSEKEDGYLGVFTRTHGWRWIRVRLADDPKTAFELDPVAFENNFMQWDMQIVASQPHWCKRMLTQSWVNPLTDATGAPGTVQQVVDTTLSIITGLPIIGATVGYLIQIGQALITGAIQLVEGIFDLISGGIRTIEHLVGIPTTPGQAAGEHPLAQALAELVLLPGKEIGEGHIKLANRGNVEAYPKFIVSTPGFAWIQDGIGGDMVALPLTTDSDGEYILVDTDPTKRTLTAANEVHDPLFLQILRNSQLVEFLLHDVVDSTEPIWKRFNGKGFQHSIPPRSVADLKVRHSQHGGTITAYMPQHYKMGYA